MTTEFNPYYTLDLLIYTLGVPPWKLCTLLCDDLYLSFECTDIDCILTLSIPRYIHLPNHYYYYYRPIWSSIIRMHAHMYVYENLKNPAHIFLDSPCTHGQITRILGYKPSNGRVIWAMWDESVLWLQPSPVNVDCQWSQPDDQVRPADRDLIPSKMSEPCCPDWFSTTLSNPDIWDLDLTGSCTDLPNPSIDPSYPWLPSMTLYMRSLHLHMHPITLLASYLYILH